MERIAKAVGGDGNGFEMERIAEADFSGGGGDIETYKKLVEGPIPSVVSLDVSSVRESFFTGCSELESINLPLATTIGSSAFQFCSRLTSVNIPLATTIGSSAFCRCSSLTSIDLPAVTTIGSSAFASCTSLTSVYLYGSSVPSLYQSASLTFGNSASFYVRASMYSAFIGANRWSNISVRIISVSD